MIELIILVLVLAWLLGTPSGCAVPAYGRGGIFTVLLVIVILWLLFELPHGRYYF